MYVYECMNSCEYIFAIFIVFQTRLKVFFLIPVYLYLCICVNVCVYILCIFREIQVILDVLTYYLL